jgi:uncharacterized protein (DUF2267 family)/predicted transcriptional regulator
MGVARRTRMSLERYCLGKRTVIQSSGTSVYDATRALENNHIGAIVVQDAGHVVGIVTDRDLAQRVIGFELDPKETRLADVMTPDPTTVSIDDDEEQAAKLMRARHVRRIPIVDEEGRAAGIVTLDDLVMDAAVDPSIAADIIEAQLAEPAPAKPAGATHPVRRSTARPSPPGPAHEPRAENTLRTFREKLERLLSFGDVDHSFAAFQLVVSALVERLTPGQAKDFVSQLPSHLRDQLLDLRTGPNLDVTRASIEAEVADALDLDPEDAATVVRKVCSSLGELVNPGEVEHMMSQLPEEMREIFMPLPEPSAQGQDDERSALSRE